MLNIDTSYASLLKLVAFVALVSCTQAVLSKYCDRCDEDRCPHLNFCLGTVIKDHCDCCNVCSSETHQPHVIHAPQVQPESSCKEVTCPKYKICVENVQKLPLCSCASPFSCSRKRREVCGKDGETYHSRCHLRIAACKLEQRIKVKHRGPCRGDETPNGDIDVDDSDLQVSGRQKDYNHAKIGRKKGGGGRLHSGNKGGGGKTGKGLRKWKKERKQHKNQNKNRKNRKDKKLRSNKRRRRTKRERKLKKNKRRYRSHSLKSLKRKYRFLGFNWKTGKWM